MTETSEERDPDVTDVTTQPEETDVESLAGDHLPVDPQQVAEMAALDDDTDGTEDGA